MGEAMFDFSRVAYAVEPSPAEARSQKEARASMSREGGQMDRLSSRTSQVEALAIVCLVSVILFATTLVVQFGCPGVVELFSGVQLTAFVQ